MTAALYYRLYRDRAVSAARCRANAEALSRAADLCGAAGERRTAIVCERLARKWVATAVADEAEAENLANDALRALGIEPDDLPATTRSTLLALLGEQVKRIGELGDDWERYARDAMRCAADTLACGA